MIERFFGAGTSQGSQPCTILLDNSLHGKSRPTLLIGQVFCQGTDDRENPPDPISDFPCGDPHSPFGKGHIMALSLGGPDVRENIVPQYEQWQANGRWRAMERSAGTAAKTGDYFVVSMTYGDGTNALPSQTTRFGNGEIFDWAEYRIPTQFDIWIVKSASVIGKKIATNVFGAASSGLRMAAALDVKTDLAGVGASHQFDHSTMPDEDRHHWQDLVCIVPSVASAMDVYNADRKTEIDGYRMELEADSIGRARAQTQMADVMRSPVHTPTTFVLEQSAYIRDVIWNEYGSMGSVVHNFPNRADVDNLTTDRILRAHRFAKQSGSLDRLKDTERKKRTSTVIRRDDERAKLARSNPQYGRVLDDKGKR